MTSIQEVRVPIAIDVAELERQLAALRLLCSQVGFALDTALVSLRERTTDQP